MKLGQEITVIDPDFAFRRWLGFEGDEVFIGLMRVWLLYSREMKTKKGG